MASIFPQYPGQPSTAASEQFSPPSEPSAPQGIEFLPPLPEDKPAAQSADGIQFLPPEPQDQPKFDPPAAQDDAERKRYVLNQWYNIAGRALRAPAGATEEAALKRIDRAEQAFNGKVGDHVGEGENAIPLMTYDTFSNPQITPEGWGAYARHTATPEVQAKYDTQFENQFELQKKLEARQNIALDTFKKFGGIMETQPTLTPAMGQGDAVALHAANEAMIAKGLPPLTPEESGQLINMKNGATKVKQNWFLDTAGDVAGSLVRATSQTVAAPGNFLLDVGNSINNKLNGPRAPGEETTISSLRKQSEEFQKLVAEHTPALSGRAQEGGIGGTANWALTELANAAPALGEMLLTGGASGSQVAARVSAALVGGLQSAEGVHDEIVAQAKQQGLGDSAAEDLGTQSMAVIGPVSAALNFLPLHQILDKNPEIRSAIVRIASSAAVNGAASTAQDIANQLVKSGLIDHTFDVNELKNAIESGLLVGGAVGVIPGGHGKPKGQEAPIEPTPPAVLPNLPEHAGVEFKPTFESQLPAEARLAENPEFMKGLSEAQKNIQESDALLKRVNAVPGAEPLQGRLPENTDLRTGEPEHPLITRARAMSPDIRSIDEANAPANAKEAADILRKRGITPVLVEGGSLPRGLTSKDIPNAALIDASNPAESLVLVTAHEAGHVLQNNDPSTTKAILDLVPEGDKARIKAQYEEAYTKGEIGRGATPEQAQAKFDQYWQRFQGDETVSSAIHEAVTTDGSVRRALIGDTSVWGKVRDAVMRVVNSFTAGGKLRNEIATRLRDAFKSETKLPSETASGTTQLPASKNYYQVGHNTAHNEELWWAGPDGITVKKTPLAHLQIPDAAQSDFKGRIDHTTKDISITYPLDEPGADLRASKIASQLQEKYPGYAIHIPGEHGNEVFHEPNMLPKEVNGLPKDQKETDSLPSLPNIRYTATDPTMTERVKAIINSAKDSTTQFKMTWIDKLRKAVQNDMWAVVKATNAAKVRGGGEVLPSSDPTVLYSVLRGAGEAHAEQRDTGMRDAQNQVILDPQTKQPITSEWKLKPLLDAAQAQFGETTGNHVDRMMRATVDTLVSQATIERGNNRVRTEEFKAMQEKIKQIIRSLPAGERLVKTLEDQSGGQPNIEHDPRLAELVKTVKDQHKATLGMLKQAMQTLADMREMNKAADLGPGATKGEVQKKSGIPSADAIDKAKAKLDAIYSMIDAEQTGQPLKPNDVLSQKELDAIHQKALERPLAGISGEEPTGHKDIAVATTTLDEMGKTPGWKAIQESARRYRLWGDMTLQKLVDQGFITSDAARKMRVSNEFYTNMQRVMDESGLGTLYEGSAAVHKFRGSNRLIDNPYVNQDVTTDRLLKVSQENVARRAFVDLVGKYPDLAEKVSKGDDTTVTVLRDGVPEFWKVNPEIKDALESLTKYHPEFLGGLLNTFGRVKRWGVTKVPAFILRNFTRDFQDRLFKGDSHVKDILHALDKELISEMTAGGGSMQRSKEGSARLDYHRELSRRIKDLSSDKSTMLAVPSKLWQGYSHLNDVSENANRVAEYNAAKIEAKRRGWSDYDASLYAASKSRGLVDFAVAGSVIRQINRVAYMAFLNGRIQGSLGDFAAIRNRPGSVALKALIMGTAPAVAAYAIASAQNKDEEYRALPIWRRTMFTNFYVGMGTVKWISIPKVPLAALFAAPVEFGIEKAAGRKDALKQIALQGVNVFSPVDDPSVIPGSFMLEGLANYSFYYNRNIIPDWERTLPIERRNTEGSSALGKMLSGITKAAGFQIDPRFIDNAMSRQFGGTGQLAESLSNLGSGKPMDTIGSFLSRTSGFTAETPGASSPDIAYVYNNASNYYDEGSPEVKQIAAYLKQGYTAADRAAQDEAFAKARDLARSVRKEYDDQGDRLKAIGKLNTDIKAVQAEYKTVSTFEGRLKWAKDNPDKLKLLKEGESFDRIYTRINELRKLRLQPDLSPGTKIMASRETERLYSAIMKMVE